MQSPATFATNTYAPFRPEWLALRSEEALEPDIPIIDAHHHLWDAPRQRYLIGDFLSDVRSGHRITASVYVECRHAYRATGPVSLRPLGEVEFASGIASQAQEDQEMVPCERIVGHADLTLGDAVTDVIEGLVVAGRGRLAGIRHVSAFDADPMVISPRAAKPAGLLSQPEFRRAFRQLERFGLCFDAFLYHHQIPDLTQLARSFPQTTIVLDHVGCPVGIGSYAGRRDSVFLQWKSALSQLARCQNVFVKLGGLGMQVFGFNFHHQPMPPSSEELASAWRPYVDTCVQMFGPERCMFESNFPPDKGTCSYGVLWNAFKRLAAGYSASEKARLFRNTAAQVYGVKS